MPKRCERELRLERRRLLFLREDRRSNAYIEARASVGTPPPIYSYVFNIIIMIQNIYIYIN